MDKKTSTIFEKILLILITLVLLTSPLRLEEAMKLTSEEIQMLGEQYDPNFASALAFVLDAEKGYNNDATDSGGETNLGITKRSYPEEDIPRMTVSRAAEIYFRDYWTPLPMGLFALEAALFDTSVNIGKVSAIKLLQRAVWDIKVDGIIGDETLNKIQSMGDESATKLLLLQRELYYFKLCLNPVDGPRHRTKLGGWRNRVEKLRQTIL